MSNSISTAVRSPMRRGLRVTVLAFGLALGSALALTAWAHGGGIGGGMGMMGPGMHGGGMGPMGGRHLERMLDGIDATEQQRAQVKHIVEAAAADLRAQAEQRRALHERARQVFTAPTVDANAVEQVRQQMLAQHDQASKRMSAAMLEVSRVLTPEQRAKIAERMQQRAERMRERREQWQRGGTARP